MKITLYDSQTHTEVAHEPQSPIRESGYYCAYCAGAVCRIDRQWRHSRTGALSCRGLFGAKPFAAIAPAIVHT